MHAVQQAAAGHTVSSFDLAEMIGCDAKDRGEFALAEADGQSGALDALADGLLGCIHGGLVCDPSLRRAFSVQACGLGRKACWCTASVMRWNDQDVCPAMPATAGERSDQDCSLRKVEEIR